MDVKQLFDLKGSVCVITGAGGALCGSLAKGLAQAGVKVALLDLDFDSAHQNSEEICQKGGEAFGVGCDVLDKKQLASACEKITQRWGTIDYLITGAGGNDPRGSTEDVFFDPTRSSDEAHKTLFGLDESGFKQVFDLNFLGTFYTIQIFGKVMADCTRGSIVTISSMSADRPLTKVPAYSAAKAAVSNFTRWLAVHLAPSGLRINAIAPGFFMTEQLRFLHIDQKTGELTERAKQVIAHTPLGRYGEPEDLLGTVIWLLSPSSRFVTGAVIPIDGGFSAYSI